MVSSNATVRPLVTTAVGQNAEPARVALFGVSIKLVAFTVAEPFNCHPPPVGEFGSGLFTPAPVNVIVFRPEPSLLVMSQPADAAPNAAGANRTVPVTDAPAGTVVPSGMFAVAENTPIGGFDLVRVNGAPPSFVTVKLSDFEAPMATLP